MSTLEHTYYADLFLGFTIRISLYVGILLIVVLTAGCGRIDEGGNPFGRDSKISLADQEARTRNSLPQGGENEKSDCAPRKSSE